MPAARSRPRRTPPERLSELLPKVLDDLALGQTAEALRLVKAWDEALGPELSPHCRPEGLRRNVVQAHVRDSAWMQRLQMERPRILAKLRQALPDAEDLEIRFRIGPLDD